MHTLALILNYLMLLKDSSVVLKRCTFVLIPNLLKLFCDCLLTSTFLITERVATLPRCPVVMIFCLSNVFETVLSRKFLNSYELTIFSQTEFREGQHTGYIPNLLINEFSIMV